MNQQQQYYQTVQFLKHRIAELIKERDQFKKERDQLEFQLRQIHISENQ